MGRGALGEIWKVKQATAQRKKDCPNQNYIQRQNGRESGIFNTGQRSRNALRLSWMETNWNEKLDLRVCCAN